MIVYALYICVHIPIYYIGLDCIDLIDITYICSPRNQGSTNRLRNDFTNKIVAVVVVAELRWQAPQTSHPNFR